MFPTRVALLAIVACLMVSPAFGLTQLDGQVNHKQGDGGQPPPKPPEPQEPAPTAPSTPRLTAAAGDGEVRLRWYPSSDDASYELRIDGMKWTAIGRSNKHTVRGLVNGTTYSFEVRAVNAIGKSNPSNRVRATPISSGRRTFDLIFAHFANGGMESITTEAVLLNAGTRWIRPVLHFSDRQGNPVDAASIVDVTGDLEIREDGGLTIRTAIRPQGVLTVATHGRGDEVVGSVRVLAGGDPLGGMLRYIVPRVGATGVGASQPAQDILFPAHRQQGGIRTAAALHNLGETPITVQCALRGTGAILEKVEIPLAGNGQTSWFIDEAFTGTDTTDFAGTVRCSTPEPGRFAAIAVEVDRFNHIYATLPVVSLK